VAAVVCDALLVDMISAMASSDYLEILLSHDRWATHEILKACEGLSDGQFHHRFEIGPGSLHDTLTHMLAAIRVWTRTLAGVDAGQRLDQDGVKRNPTDLTALADTVYAEYAKETTRLPASQTVTRMREGKTFQFTRAAVLVHVATHGAHHRAQCLNMLRHLCVKPLPRTSVTEWTIFGEGQS
jgi:uncharacterized damage-inducible protein DinB